MEVQSAVKFPPWPLLSAQLRIQTKPAVAERPACHPWSRRASRNTEQRLPISLPLLPLFPCLTGLTSSLAKLIKGLKVTKEGQLLHKHLPLCSRSASLAGRRCSLTGQVDVVGGFMNHKKTDPSVTAAVTAVCREDESFGML